MKITSETAEHMIQFLTFSLSRIFRVDADSDELYNMVDELFNQYCDLLHIDHIEQFVDLDEALQILFADSEEE